MVDIQRSIYEAMQQQHAPAAAQPPFASLHEMLSSLTQTQDLLYIADAIAAACDDPLPVLAARLGEDRAMFLAWLQNDMGVAVLPHRQRFCNTLMGAVKARRISKGWETKAEPEPRCDSCGRLSAAGAKLMICARCKGARYCNATCQKAHWTAGHKLKCQRPEPEKKSVLGAEPPSHTNAVHGSFKSHQYQHGYSHIPKHRLDPRPVD